MVMQRSQLLKVGAIQSNFQILLWERDSKVYVPVYLSFPYMAYQLRAPSGNL